MDLADQVIKTLFLLALIPVVGIGLLAITDSRVANTIGKFFLVLTIGGIVGYFVYRVATTPPETSTSAAPAVQPINYLPLINIMLLLAASIVVGIAIFVVTVKVVPLVVNFIDESARERYRDHFLLTAEAETKNKAQTRATSDLLASLPPHIKFQIIGQHGTGKTTLLWQMGRHLAARDSKFKYLPVFVDLEREGPEALRLLQEDLVSYLKKKGLPAREMRVFVKTLRNAPEEIVFIFDSRFLLSRSMALTSNDSVIKLVSETINRYRECSLILATHSPDLDLLENKVELNDLDDNTIQEYLHYLPGGFAHHFPAEFFFRLIQDQSRWLELARKHSFLFLLTDYFIKENTLPADLRDLFLKTLYSKGRSIDEVERLGSRIALEMIQKKKHSIPVDELKSRVQIDETAIRDTFGDTALLVRHSDAEPAVIEFAHSFYLEYFLALSISTDSAPAAEISHAFQLYVKNDPFWLDVFNLFCYFSEKSGESIIDMIDIEEADIQKNILGIKKLILGFPNPTLPDPLLGPLSSHIFKDLSDPANSRRAWQLLESLPDEKRMLLYSKALTELPIQACQESLFWLSQNHRSELMFLLWNGSDEISDIIGNYLALQALDREVPEVVDLFVQLFREGVDRKKVIALNILGSSFSRSEVGNVLFSLLNETTDPDLKTCILGNLVKSGVDSILTLINIAANLEENEEVRNFAIDLLLNSNSPELFLQQSIHQILELNLRKHTPETQVRVEKLIERLRAREPVLVDKLKISLIPYVTGNPVFGELFFGREKILHEIRVAIERAHVALIGERRIGKTSILYQLHDELSREFQRGSPVIPVPVDLESSGTKRDLSEGEENAEIYLQIIKCIEEKLYGSDAASYSDCNFRQFERALLKAINHIKQEHGKRAKLVLLIDEADELSTCPDSQLAKLRGSFNDYRIVANLVLVLAGVGKFMEEWSRSTSPFFNTFKKIPVTPFTDEEAIELITKPIAGTISYDPEAVNRIIALSNHRPFIIQSLCMKVVTEIYQQGGNHVSVSAVEEAYSRLDDKHSKIINDVISSLEELITGAQAGRDEESIAREARNLADRFTRAIQDLNHNHFEAK